MILNEKSLNRINKPTSFLGLKPLDVLLVFSSLILILISFWFILIIAPLLIFIITNLHKAVKRGCPDFIGETFNKISVQTSFTDKNCIMSKL